MWKGSKTGLSLAIVLCVLVVLPSALGSGGESDPHPVGEFEAYVLELLWTPDFCCTRGTKRACDFDVDSRTMTHLTLHGLYPAYDTVRGRDKWPNYCGAAAEWWHWMLCWLRQ